MREKKFIKFFVCPNCKEPLCQKSKIQDIMNENFCGKCGTKIDTAIKQAMPKFVKRTFK